MYGFEGMKFATVGQTVRTLVACRASGSFVERMKQQKGSTWHELMGNAVMSEHQLNFELNINMKIFDCIAGAGILEQFGFELPENVKIAVLMKQHFFKNKEAIQNMLDTYNNIVHKLTTAQMNFLRDHLRDVETEIQPGLFRIVWTSMGILEYSAFCLTKVRNLKSLFQQIEHVELDIIKKIVSLSKYNLFEFKIISEQPYRLPCKEFFVDMSDRRTEKIFQMVKIYESIGPILIKLESLVLHTNTGKASYMEQYYSHWENEIYSSLIKMALQNLENISEVFEKQQVLFQVDAILVVPELQLKPTPTDTINIIMKDIKNLLSRLKSFRRWMNKTCLLCEPQKVLDSDEYFNYSFYDDVLPIEKINTIITKIQEYVHQNLLKVHKHLQRWKRYRNLWTFDKPITCNKFLTKNHSLSKFDEKFAFYDKIIKVRSFSLL